MKKQFFQAFATFVLALTSVVGLSACDNGRTIEPENIPSASKSFLKTHFPDCGILRVTMEHDSFFGKEYDVTLDCGVEIDFNKNGEWTDIDCNHSPVPDAIIPANILNYVREQYSNNFIVKIEKKRNGYEVELNNDLDLVFDKGGNFVRIDY
ncbi:MAG: PepSY-like domain-containing protein [Candidatus Aphodosoma sp.]